MNSSDRHNSDSHPPLGDARIAETVAFDSDDASAPAPDDDSARVMNPTQGSTVAATATGGRLTVTDNGPGIPPALRARVFERYVSTKSTGTGLGLALIRDAVVRSGGTIR
ncbi:MAG: sensor histidine kinase, partial [Myxococcota bacterium]